MGFRLRRLWLLLLLGQVPTLAQEQRDDEGMSIDEAPSGAEPDTATSHPAREPGAKVATVVVKSKNLSLAVPTDWVLSEGSEEKAAAAWDVRLPGSEKRALLTIFDGGYGDGRDAPFVQARWFREHHPRATLEFRTKPWPQLIGTYPVEVAVRPPWMDWYLYRSFRNSVFTIRFSCTAEDFARSEQDVLAAVASFTAEVERSPAIPKGYKTSAQGPWLLAVAPSVTASTAPILKVLKEQEQRFKRDHGAVPKSDVPMVVFVHNVPSEATKVDPKAAEWEEDFHVDVWRRCIFALPLNQEKPDDAGWLAGCVQGLLFCTRYGDTEPHWVYMGERTLARAEAITGKPLPVLDAGFYSWSKEMKLHKIDELDVLRSSNWSAWSREAFFYVASLHAGKHKKAYAKFLEDFLATADGEGALSRQLWPIGLDQLHAAAIEFTYQKILPLEPKEKEK
jgi:hypothetical protein